MCLEYIIIKKLTYGDFKLALLSPKFSISNFLKLCITVATLQSHYFWKCRLILVYKHNLYFYFRKIINNMKVSCLDKI